VSSTDPTPAVADTAAAVLAVLSELETGATKAIEAAADLDALREAEGTVSGKRSSLAGLQRRLGGLTADERRDVGAQINATRARLLEALAARRVDLDAAARSAALAADRLDLTEAMTLVTGWAAPGGADLPWRGHLNLVTQTRDELEDTFVSLGFAVAEGPEAETDWYNFEALNMPPAHPARGMWDTLYLRLGAPETVLLRTHTSPVQARVMEAEKPPIYIVAPGRCYRRDTPDARHLPVFHQIEGLVVDRGITFGDLAGTIEAFTTSFFGPAIHSRLRPSYFPFTEPSAEFEVTCPICGGVGCRTCSGSGWIELGGCGMVDPAVFASVGIDAEEFSGFAFGFGIDRLAQVRAGLSDMRALLDNDLRFLTQF
jgi:phenylalanyl-tRNA synthetase alpha chain